MQKIKFDKKIMMASFSKTFGHVIRPINPDKVKRISVDDYFQFVKKNGRKRAVTQYEKFHGVMRRMPKHCWIVWLEGCRLIDGTVTDGFVVAFDKEAHRITSVDLVGIFDLVSQADGDDDDDDGDDEPVVSESYMSCFCANENNCSCVSTVTTGPSPGDSCSSDNDCGGTGTSPNPFDQLVILRPNDF